MRLVDDDGATCAGDRARSGAGGPTASSATPTPALTAAAFDADGWFMTGDIGVLDDDGYLTITDRKKDIIIRGGENISAAEVEELLCACPASPRSRWSPRPTPASASTAPRSSACSPGTPTCPRLDDVRAHLEAAGLATAEVARGVAMVDEFPRTASGKVQKYKVRKEISVL